MTEKSSTLSMRWMLVVLGSTMYFLVLMLKNSLSVAIVAMVNTTKSTEDEFNTTFACRPINNSVEENEYSDTAEFNWTTSQQGLVLSGYLWGYFIGKVFGSRFVEVIGQREVAAISMGVGCVLELLIPISAELSVYAIMTVRILMGIAHGPIFSALHSLIAKYAPQKQLSSMITLACSGAPLGAMFGVLTAGWIIDGMGWKAIFYIQGGISLIWLPFWIYFVRNDPAKHPFVTQEELLIMTEDKSSAKQKRKAPWKSIFTSPYLYVCIFGSFAQSWVDVIMSAAGPTFLSKQIGISLSNASLVSSTTSLLALPALLIYGFTSDYLIKNAIFTKSVTRKIFHTLTTLGVSTLLLGIILSGCNIGAVVSFWVALGLVRPAYAVSVIVSVIDFAPNFTGTLMGLIGIGNGLSSFGPVVISSLVQHENGWDQAFYISIGLSLISFLLYVTIMTDKPQSWNYEKSNSINEEFQHERARKSSFKNGGGPHINDSFSDEKDR